MPDSAPDFPRCSEDDRRFLVHVGKRLSAFLRGRGAGLEEAISEVAVRVGSPLRNGRKGEETIRRWLMHQHPFTETRARRVSLHEMEGLREWVRKVAKHFDQAEQEWLHPLAELHRTGSSEIAVPVENGHDRHGRIVSRSDDGAADLNFEAEQRRLPSGGAYVLCSVDLFRQFDQDDPQHATTWRRTTELVERGVVVQLVSASSHAAGHARKCVEDATDLYHLEPNGVRHTRAPLSVVSALGTECQIVVFDGAPLESEREERVDDVRNHFEKLLIRAAIGVRHGESARSWFWMGADRAATLVWDLRAQRRMSSNGDHDRATVYDARTWPPEHISNAHGSALKSGECITIVTGSYFLEVGKERARDFYRDEGSVRSETEACLNRGVHYKYVALPESGAEESLVLLRRWIETLALKGRGSASFLIAPIHMRKHCPENGRLIVHSPAKTPGARRMPNSAGDHRDVVYASVPLRDERGERVFAYTLLPNGETKEVLELLRRCTPLGAKSGSTSTTL